MPCQQFANNVSFFKWHRQLIWSFDWAVPQLQQAGRLMYLVRQVFGRSRWCAHALRIIEGHVAEQHEPKYRMPARMQPPL